MRGNASAIGAVVLCGGRSTRMGRPKLSLPFGHETLLQRVVRILAEVADPIVVVAAPEQEVPPLPAGVEIVRDPQEGLGPLAGLATGLESLQPRAPLVYASACDVPLLRPEFVREVIARLGEHDLAIPRDGEFQHPLAAVYRTRLAPLLRELIASGRRRPLDLIDRCDAVRIDVAELRKVDPRLDSLRNLNTPDEYRAALLAAGLAPA
jgi:molybdopterin-guanine dinucleotide biosynthesis protein A